MEAVQSELEGSWVEADIRASGVGAAHHIFKVNICPLGEDGLLEV
jgi:hypothetical protein